MTRSMTGVKLFDMIFLYKTNDFILALGEDLILIICLISVHASGHLAFVTARNGRGTLNKIDSLQFGLGVSLISSRQVIPISIFCPNNLYSFSIKLVVFHIIPGDLEGAEKAVSSRTGLSVQKFSVGKLSDRWHF